MNMVFETFLFRKLEVFVLFVFFGEAHACIHTLISAVL